MGINIAGFLQRYVFPIHYPKNDFWWRGYQMIPIKPWTSDRQILNHCHSDTEPRLCWFVPGVPRVPLRSTLWRWNRFSNLLKRWRQSTLLEQARAEVGAGGRLDLEKNMCFFMYIIVYFLVLNSWTVSMKYVSTLHWILYACLCVTIYCLPLFSLFAYL